MEAALRLRSNNSQLGGSLRHLQDIHSILHIHRSLSALSPSCAVLVGNRII